MEIKILGAAGIVTGSSYLLTSDTTSFLIDCGMFQGPNTTELNYTPFDFDASKLSGILITHAHLDHCGRLPLVLKNGYVGKIYMTPATKALLELSLKDAANVAKDHPTRTPLYSVEDVVKLLSHIQTISYEEELRIHDFIFVFHDAGHILGSSTITAVHNDKTIVFSGDLGNSPAPLVRPTTPIKQADVVIMESTYGDHDHVKEDLFAHFQREVNAIEENDGTLLIPAFSLDRTQEILHIFNHLKSEKKINVETPVFLDSPMGIAATTIYSQFNNLWNDELKSHTDNPFNFPNLHMIKDGSQSKKIKRVLGAKVIVAGNGMMSGGRILGHAKRYLPLPTTRVFIVGFQAPETIGRQILDGAKNVIIDKDAVPVNATVTNIDAMSAHADQDKLLNWLHVIQGVKTVLLTHGEDMQRQALEEKITALDKNINLLLPTLNQTVPL